MERTKKPWLFSFNGCHIDQKPTQGEKSSPLSGFSWNMDFWPVCLKSPNLKLDLGFWPSRAIIPTEIFERGREGGGCLFHSTDQNQWFVQFGWNKLKLSNIGPSSRFSSLLYSNGMVESKWRRRRQYFKRKHLNGSWTVVLLQLTLLLDG